MLNVRIGYTFVSPYRITNPARSPKPVLLCFVLQSFFCRSIYILYYGEGRGQGRRGLTTRLQNVLVR